MKAILMVIIFCMGTVALAADPLPTYLPTLKGVVIDSMTERSEFDFTPGDLKKCERRVVSSDWVLYTCSVEGVYATISDKGGTAQRFGFDKVHISFRYAGENYFINEYIFSGHWRGSPGTVTLSSEVTLELSHPRKVPDLVRGTIYLKDYKFSRPVHATP